MQSFKSYIKFSPNFLFKSRWLISIEKDKKKKKLFQQVLKNYASCKRKTF